MMEHVHKERRGGGERGISLLVAIIIMGTLLLVATAISNVAYKQFQISTSSRESQYAFYAADTGAECALYWDIKNPSGVSAFATSTTATVTCNQDGANNANQFTVGGTGHQYPDGYFSDLMMTFLPDPYCAHVIVTKLFDGTTRIQSYGYNTCDSSSARRVERAVQITY